MISDKSSIRLSIPHPLSLRLNMFVKSTCLLLLLGSCIGGALPNPVVAAPSAGVELSNAERISRGMPLNKPKRMYDPSKLHG
jgi:hypothetical protein